MKSRQFVGAAALGAAAIALTLGVTSQAYAASDTITLGAAVSMTGKYSTNGKNTKNGYDLAVKLINDHGGVKIAGKTYKIAVKYYDDESTPARGTQLAERLIQQDGVRYMLGPYSSGLTKAMAPVAENNGVPMVEANGASNSLFTKGYKYLFAVLSTSDKYLQSAVSLAGEVNKGKTVRIAGVFQNDPFSQDIRNGVLADAKRIGAKMVIDDKLPPELNDMTATLIKVKALKPDLLVVSGHDKGAALAIRQLSDMRINVPMLAMTHCDSADIIGKFGKAAEYTLCASQWDRTLSYKDPLFGTAEDFAKLFEKTYGYAPPYQAAESAAAVLVYKDAFERANSLDQKKVRDALAATDMETFYGKVKFNAEGENIAKPMVLFQVQDGQYKVVAPAKWAAAKLRWPTPVWSKR
ncbi:amino acid ABC transporter substrate-binding protein [Varunaivibrio sulfuroxidans]|uniref:Amino acid/amide ABC transporter substrate-binding protein (HAAT family) n=1 Tax=Varunaivibrio sulfuroxidans TaxID=1773489 RepID=A0A4V2UP01_9PROT|nr:amino acid ABC transporter substrate-binding protein [Varunaivibrio sulfuroxidans]TCS64061.1 amino acid/amide ABC transporter substrate-binding protein (HAAT family) [Varunaivibrio sulfuroxidans]WES31488.1 amino acid ABC transporter substrate-binding protein [Varunaivibrio sulfuroxidans]